MTLNVKKKFSDVLEEVSSKGWKLLLLDYRIISSLSEVPCDAHTSAQTSCHGKADPACLSTHSLLATPD